MTKYIFITGGVISSLGKGIASSSIGALLQSRGFSIKLRKLDPYLNTNPGLMCPSEHGEIFITDDGVETDLDLGHYERFTGNNETKYDTITTGKIYSEIIKKEKDGEFLGKTVQVLPHITNIIKNFITNQTENIDFILIEIGGTVGDIEGLPFIEAIRQLSFEIGRENSCFVHLTYLPYISTSEELKTKPTQHSVRSLQSLGVQPDILLCRADSNIPEKELKKIALFCNIKEDNVIPALNAKNIYEVPLLYHKSNLDTQIMKYFHLENKQKINLSIWEDIQNKILNTIKELKVAIIGKHISLKDSYKSIIEALNHAGLKNNRKINIIWLNSENIKNNKDLDLLKEANGIIVPGGFSEDGVEGTILSIEFARKNNIPFLGISLGMQLAIVEFARNILNLKDANSVEFSPSTKNPVIIPFDKNNTARVGGFNSKINKDSIFYQIYKKNQIRERYRHKYTFNTQYQKQFEENGLNFSIFDIENNLAESIELKDHKCFIGVQFHPELTSRPFDVNPVFDFFVEKTL